MAMRRCRAAKRGRHAPAAAGGSTAPTDDAGFTPASRVPHDAAKSCHLLPFAYPAPMDSMNISLPGALKAFVESEIANGRYRSASEYVRELIRADEKRKARETLETLLLEGLASPEAEWTKQDIDDIRASARAAH